MTWLLHHEARLAWRDWVAMVRAGGTWRWPTIALSGLAFLAISHLIAYAVLGRLADQPILQGKTSSIVITAIVGLAWALILSQAIESVTRVFYTRSDLDLIMSSPFAVSAIFSIRVFVIAMTVTAMALLLSFPLVNVLMLSSGPKWLLVYGVIVAAGLSATAIAIAIAIALFCTVGPSKTRLAAQIVAAVVGAGFVIGLQIAAILSYGTMSRFAILSSDAAIAFAPNDDSPIWWPARAIQGDSNAMLMLLGGSMGLLGLASAMLSPLFGRYVGSVAANATTTAQVRRVDRFRGGSRRQALRRKEFILLRRDPWLVSQTLMQLLYLLPPALMMWRSFADASGGLIVVTPVIVMAAGQLAGGLAWLTISGEDASDLIGTAPLMQSHVTRAKIEVVLAIVGSIFALLVLPLALGSPLLALVTAAGAAIAASSATAIQLWFRVQARRSQFRRRQTSSRLATFAEAFSSIGWAATAALALTFPWLAVTTAAMTAGMLALTWKLSPVRN